MPHGPISVLTWTALCSLFKMYFTFEYFSTSPREFLPEKSTRILNVVYKEIFNSKRP